MSRPTRSAMQRANVADPPLPDGSLTIHVTEPVDAIHPERSSERTVDRYREAVMLDRIFWISMAVLMIAGVSLRIWAML